MDIEKQIQEIKEKQAELQALERALAVYIRNSEDLSVDDKYKAYLEIEHNLPVKGFYYNFETLHEDTVVCGGFVHVDRYQTILFSEVIGTIGEYFEYWLDSERDFDNIDKYLLYLVEQGAEALGIEDSNELQSRVEECFEKQLEAVIQEILESGYGGFIYDW